MRRRLVSGGNGMCRKCESPDVGFLVNLNPSVVLKCAACGEVFKVRGE